MVPRSHRKHLHNPLTAHCVVHWTTITQTGAIAAGCGVVVKPSELTPATSQLIAELFPKYLDPVGELAGLASMILLIVANQDLYQVVNGAIAETTEVRKSCSWRGPTDVFEQVIF